MPVARSVVTESTVATVRLSEAKVIVAEVMGLPNWCRACAVNCVDPPTTTLDDGGEMLTPVSRDWQLPKGAPLTRVPGENLLPPAPVAVVCSVKLPLMSGERVSD